MPALHLFFASSPKGVTASLVDELKALGAQEISEKRAGVSFRGDMALGYRACLWSRTASRVLLMLSRFRAETREDLYEGAGQIPWDEHLALTTSFAVDASIRQSHIPHTVFAAQVVKDAIVDQFRSRDGQRPSVDLEKPDVRLNLFIDRDEATLSLDLSGEALHRRGYRTAAMEAPLKENLAAALLLRCGWAEIARGGGAFVDPLCGSGTLLIEAAMIAGDIAPGLKRLRYGFHSWGKFDADLWKQILTQAEERADAGRAIPPILGFDSEAQAIAAAGENIARAGLSDRITLKRSRIEESESMSGAGPPGLVLTNPPYGERMGEVEALALLYESLGRAFMDRFQGWAAAVLTGNPALGKKIGLKAYRSHVFFNGAIECRLLRFKVPTADQAAASVSAPQATAALAESAGAQMFRNRLQKNLRELQRWATREGIRCYRLYDADMPEYALAIDLYESDRRYAHVAEYAAPASVDPVKARKRLREALAVMPEALSVAREQIFFKRRERQRGSSQYEKITQSGEFHEVQEGGCRILVNFSDYLDTGLFLDHRITRALIASLARGKRFLNLFCYTATATVAAARAGAIASDSIDMSATYLEWAQRNFALNDLDPGRHELIRADCLEWLEQRSTQSQRRYGLIFLDPPTFSNSARMRSVLDLQRDHVGLIRRTAELLEANGILIFSTNRQKFKLDREALNGFAIEDISAATLPRDFVRNPRIHHCYRITRQ